MSDYIRREDALKAVDDIVCDADDAERTCDRIIDLPSADVAPVRHGRWIESGTWVDMYTTDEDPMFECSECGDVIIGGGIPFAYCPNCSARMDGDDDEID